MFVSRETQEKLDQLNAENAELQLKIGELQQSNEVKNPWKSIAILALVAFVLACGAAVYFGVFNKAEDPYGHIPIITREGVKDWSVVPDSGIAYHVQIGAFKQFDLSSYQSELEGIYLFKNDSLQRITLGRFVRFDEAQIFQEKMVELGMEFAYITAYKDNEPMGLMAAIKEEAALNP